MDGPRRNGDRRRSGSHEPPGTSARKPSKQASSTDRQGLVFNEGRGDQTARPVTPEVPIEENSTARSPALMPTSPSARDGSSEARPRAGSRTLLGSTNDTQQRSRRGTLEERIRKHSPAAQVRNRNRIGSLQGGRTSSPEPDEPPSSIGFPSVTSSASTPGFSSRQRLIKSPPPRPLSPATNHHGVPTFPVEVGTLPSPTSDAGRILSLMKTTCGRMQGILTFRINSTGAWTSGYCAINVGTGSLIYQESKMNYAQTKTLIDDLRGCLVRTQGAKYSDQGYIEVVPRGSSIRVHLRPRVPETTASWLAALLCWQPLKPKPGQSTIGRVQPPAHVDYRPVHQRRNSSFNLKDAATIKLGQMLLWDHDAHVVAPSSPRRISTYKQQRSASGTPWRRVSATLQSNGLLKLHLERDNTIVAMVPLASLCRSAVQRLHPSVLEDEYSIGIYPQYTAFTHTSLLLRQPVYLSLDTRVLFEAWFALLKSFTIPEIYGPESSAIQSPAQYVDGNVEAPLINTKNMFRLERTLHMRVTEAKLRLSSEPASTAASPQGTQDTAPAVPGDYHAEVLIDGEVRGRTAMKSHTRNPFWREDYEFGDLPPVLRTASVVIKSKNAGQRDWTLISDGQYNKGDSDIHHLTHMDITGEIQILPLDDTVGTVTMKMDDLERCKDVEDWFPIVNDQGDNIGDMLLKIRLDESIVLMSHEYQPLLDLLQQFSSGLTQQIVSTFPATELRQLPETILNIFEVSGNATEWLASLVEDEIDATDKEPNFSRFHFTRQISSTTDSYDTGVGREMLLRDKNKNANVEANLLFRGNSLLTKALDTHMKRVGKEYLEIVLGDHIRDIDESDPDCEVDPGRVTDQNLNQRHWYNLITLTENVWASIAQSVDQCPADLRAIFRRIRSCAEDRYGDFRRSVGYSSVSGFLFLRFICAAVLNPKLFGLLKDHPRQRAQRTLTLMAKSLQALANMTTFGNKEPWMEPMNHFLNSRRQEFKDFVDDICSIAADRDPAPPPPPFLTPLQIKTRLPVTSREGFPSLPYLLDISSECATLVSTWIDATSEASASDRHGRDGKAHAHEEERHLVEFDRICHSIRAKTRDVLSRAEQLDRPGGVLEVKWEELVAQMDRKSHRLAARPMRPQRLSSDPSLASRQRSSPLSGSLDTAHDSVTSLDAPFTPPDDNPALTSPPPLPPGSAPPYPSRPTLSRAATKESIWSSGGEDDKFPAHALSWGDDDADEDVRPPLTPAAASASQSAGRAHIRGLGETLNMTDNGDSSRGGGAMSPSQALSGDEKKNRDRELSNGGSGRRGLIDGWGFRRRGTAALTPGATLSPAKPDKEKEREKDRDKDKGKERERLEKREKEKEREKGRDREKEKGREREKDKSRDKERDKHRERDKDKTRDKDRDKGRDRERHREHGRRSSEQVERSGSVSGSGSAAGGTVRKKKGKVTKS